MQTDETTPVTTPDSTLVELIDLYNNLPYAERILEFCINPRSILEIIDMLGFKEKKSGRRYVTPLLEQGRLAMTIPDKPNSKNQKYITIK